MLVPGSVRELLRSHDLHPRKGFGQNFLEDTRYLTKIAEAADLKSTDLVIEVGPGLGTLTRELASRAGRVVAVEIDRDLAALLREVLGTAGLLAKEPDQSVAPPPSESSTSEPTSATDSAEPAPAGPLPQAAADPIGVSIVSADILEVDPAQLSGGRPYKVVANLPYYVTSPVLRRFLEEASVKPELMVLMVQLEVAERIVAKPGDLSLLAISVQFYGTPRIVCRVPASAFYPAPKVDSAVIRVDLFDKPAVDVEPALFFKVVQAGFSQPRKQLHNAMAQRLWLPKDAAPELLREAGVDSQRRAQTLTLDEWGSICRVLLDRGLL